MTVPRPSDQTLLSYSRQTLKWLNNQRRLRNLPTLTRIPPGRPRDHTECPVAQALGAATVSYRAWCYGGETETRRFPGYV